MIINGKQGGAALRGPASSEFAISLTATEQLRLLDSGGTALVVVDDANVSRESAPLYENEFLLALGLTAPQSVQETLRYECSGVGVINGAVASRVSYGAEAIYARTSWGAARADVIFQQSGGEAVDTFIDYVAGSLGAALAASVQSRVGTGSTAILASADDANSLYARNAACWINGDWTGRPVWNSYGGPQTNGAAISRRHMVFANHYHPPVGSTVRFLTQDNSPIERTVTALSTVAGTDITIGLLDSDLPAEISHYRTFPASVTSYLKTFQVPIICTDQEGKALAFLWNAYNNTTSWLLSSQAYTSGDFAAYSESIVGGDSGSAIFAFLNGELLIVGDHFGAGSTNPLFAYFDEVNAAITSLGGGYQLETVDLSTFTNYG
ncbi:MAG: hypothetical protein ACTHK7_01880 [Aureliella sp.]